MLTDIRKVTRGWIAGGLLSLLAVLFAFWGVRDVLRPTASDQVASGNGVAVSADEFRKAFDDALQDAREQNKRSITRQEANDAGLTQQVLRELIGQKAIDQIVRKAGFVASDSMVASAIRDQQAFHSQITGAFDRQQYAAILARNGLTQVQFEDQVRAGLARRQLATTLVAGMHTPQAIAKLLYAYDSERRVVSVAEISRARAGAPPEPTDKDLQTFYNDHKANFQTPELRNLTIIKARPDAFVAKADVSEDKIRQLYEFRKPAGADSEKRSFVEISAPTQEIAQEAARRLANGEDPDKIAASLKAQAVAFKDVAKANVPDPAVAAAVFALKQGQSSGAVNGKLAWSAARVTDIVAPSGAGPSFESQHDALRAELAKQEAQNLLSDAVEKFDQERTAGKSLEDAAKDTGLDVVQALNVNSQGSADQGGPIAAFANAPDLLKAAFLAPQGAPTDFAPTPDGGFALVRVDAIIPAGTRSFDQVKAILAPAWKANKTGEAMRAIGDGVVKAVGEGQNFRDAVAAQKLRVVAASQTLDRSALQSNTPVALLAQAAFGANEGDVVMAPDASGQTLFVAHVEKVAREAPSQNPQVFAQARAAADKMASNDLLLALQNIAFQDAAVKTNQKLIDQTLGVGAADASAAQP